jgi:Dyp-type peroxidase family
MQPRLDLADIQGNVVRAYGRYSFPVARYFFLHFGRADAGRRVVMALRERVTTAARWPQEAGRIAKPKVTLNVGFSFFGLYALGLPTRTLQGFPTEFADGMKARAFILGDRDQTLTEEEAAGWDRAWDPIWRENAPFAPTAVHAWLSMNAQVEPGTDRPVPELDEQTDWLRRLCAEQGGGHVRLLGGHGRDGAGEWQEGRAIFAEGPDGTLVPTPREHFGFTDGLGDPIFAGQLEPAEERARLPGRGKLMGKGWQPLATGEFLLGHADESQELPPAPQPWAFSRNGAFMVYRKLHQNVASWRDYFAAEARRFGAVTGLPEDAAKIALQSKVVGRWPDGVPLAKAGSFAAWTALRAELDLDDPARHLDYLKSAASSDFRYADDMPGYNAPNSCHLRRVNTRDYLDPLNDPGAHGPNANPDATTQLQKRRHILRRGLPYGPEGGDDDSEQGVVFMAICSSLFRQFEFVQQQWIQYGLDFNAGNNTCPLLGDHAHHRRFAIPAAPDAGHPPYVCDGLRTFVQPRGGEYFFIPSLTALKMIGMGIVDPT